VYQAISPSVQLCSISGGTDIISCFVLGCPTLPVIAGEIQVRGLGMAVAVLDESGTPVTGEQGELCCLAPFPSMPIKFWNDPGDAKYRAAYFEHFPGIWRHGDFIEITERGGVIIYGRSDTVLNPGGVRIGTGEIYRPVEEMEEVVDSLVVGQPWQGDVRVVLFVVLHENFELNSDLIARIKTNIRTYATPRHVPEVILEIPDVPRTISGKKVEKAVIKVIKGEEVDNTSALANPESLEVFENLRQSLMS
ncbi:MAG: AMP-binding enzyme, partial [bacterium]